jgi:hypothetical protein
MRRHDDEVDGCFPGVAGKLLGHRALDHAAGDGDSRLQPPDDIGLLLEITAELVPQVLLDGIGIDELGRRDRGDHAYEVQLGGFPPRDPGPDAQCLLRQWRTIQGHHHSAKWRSHGESSFSAETSRSRLDIAVNPT